jgi:hypothetical protein
MSSRAPCPNCNGPGISLDRRMDGRCSQCYGTGKVDPFRDPIGAVSDAVFGSQSDCLICKGSGVCQTCSGKGEVEVKDETEPSPFQWSSERDKEGLDSDSEDATESNSSFRSYGSGTAGDATEHRSYKDGGGGGFDSDFFVAKGCLVVLGLAILIPFAVIDSCQKRRTAITNLRNLQMHVVAVDAQRPDAPGVIRFAQGLTQTLTFHVSWQGSLYESGRPLKTTLLRENSRFWEIEWKDRLLSGNLSFELPGEFPQGRYVFRATVEGAPPAECEFFIKPLPPGNIYVSDRLFLDWPRDPVNEFKHQPGTYRVIYIVCGLEKPLPPAGKGVNIGLFRGDNAITDWNYTVNERNLRFYFPYQGDFAPGRYTARLSADGEPPAEFTFVVLDPETARRENERRIADSFAQVFPSSREQTASVHPANDFQTGEVPQVDVQHLLDQAAGYYRNGVYDYAIRDYQKVLEIDSSNQEARKGLEKAQRARDAERLVQR